MPIWLQVVLAVIAVPVAVALVPVVLFIGMWLIMCICAPVIAFFEGNPRYIREVWGLPFEIVREMPIFHRSTPPRVD